MSKFKEFSLKELLELLAAFQSCKRDNKVSRALFDQLEQEIENKQAVTSLAGSPLTEFDKIWVTKNRF